MKKTCHVWDFYKNKLRLTLRKRDTMNLIHEAIVMLKTIYAINLCTYKNALKNNLKLHNVLRIR